ncbi:hypothetical protein FA15DRAFT_672203 [Coprinopsis marcescibilis]|uniref:GH16 domain-containing protein n=1 Tax=Coprinopsis marcescibilis TaxID=230819 RepID=A0A5C3KN48_COPMA|nr:hypothetical protein FA15DRAFT_672203 [Coprinopsis marcescibilis]
MRSLLAIGLPILVAFLAGQADATTCNATTPCPLSDPCCSEYGFCGKGHFCLGGCNPFASKELESCKPNPICQSGNFTFPDTSRVINSTLYEGDAAKHDWVIEGGNVEARNGDLILTLTENDKGTKISSTRYVHYGTISARLKTGKWAGVITAFITMSDIKDEVDWEWPGTAVTEAQSNFFWQGVIPPFEQSAGDYHRELSDTSANYHDYTIDWQPETLRWIIDGRVVRTVNKADTLDAATGVYRYPTTPSRIQFSIWPAGIPESPPGTVEWAGGMINWNDPDYLAAGRFYALINSVTIQCANQRTGANLTSYVYASGNSVTEPVISYTNRSTHLKGSAVGLGVVGGMHRAIAGAVTLLLVIVHAF